MPRISLTSSKEDCYFVFPGVESSWRLLKHLSFRKTTIMHTYVHMTSGSLVPLLPDFAMLKASDERTEGHDFFFTTPRSSLELGR